MTKLPEAPEVVRALEKAQEYKDKAAEATTEQERKDYERLRKKWLGIADGWRVITELDKNLG